MKTKMKKAFDPIRADQNLIDRTRIAAETRALQQSKIPVRRPWKRGLAFAMAFVLLAGLFSFGAFALTQTTVAAVSIDINPSIKLEVNALQRVVSVEPFNDEGIALLASLDLVGKPAKQAIHDIVAAAVAANYVDIGTIIAITTSTDLPELKEELERETAEAAEDALEEEDQEAVVYHENSGFKRVQEATELGISPGRLNLIQKLMELDETITDAGQYIEANPDIKASEIMKTVVAMKKADRDAGKEIKTSEKEAAKAARMADAVGQAEANKTKSNNGNNGKGGK